MRGESSLRVATRRTKLGWLALAGHEGALVRVASGYRKELEALSALCLEDWSDRRSAWMETIAERLQDYAAGGWDDFRDVPLDLGHLTAFQCKVVKGCRAIEFGRTRSYAELAAYAGSPREARPVGNTMATNRFPLVVPCHRVISAGGGIGSYSGPDGVKMKARLLELEQRAMVSCGAVLT